MCGERGNAAAYGHLFYVLSGVERRVDCSQRTTANSHNGHCTYTAESANVKVQNV
jgi:hypothetical protein